MKQKHQVLIPRLLFIPDIRTIYYITDILIIEADGSSNQTQVITGICINRDKYALWNRSGQKVSVTPGSH